MSFSSSVALNMRASAHDLSRRVRLVNLHGFSFREYLAFTRGMHLPRLDLEQIAEGKWESIRVLLRFVGRSGVDGVNYSSLSRNLGITKYKAQQYVDALERAFILHRVFPAGTSGLREPKVLMTPPTRLLYTDLEDALGGLREDYFWEAMKQAGLGFQYLKSTRGAKTPDYLIKDAPGKIVVEVGGRGKGREQFKGVTVDRKLVFAHSPVPERRRLPLFLLGYLA